MYPPSIYFGLNVVPIKVLCGLSIHYLGTWTLQAKTLNPRSTTLIVVSSYGWLSKIMVPFWVPDIVRHLIFRVPKKGP